MFPEEGQDLIDLVHPKAFLALLHVPDKAKPDAGPHGKFYLREAEFLPFLLDMSG